jgi:hypothetical protein
MRVRVHAIRQQGQHHDRALVDLLHLKELGYVPGAVKTAALMQLWSCSQPNVSRRMAAINDLGVVTVVSSWGRYHVIDERPAVTRPRPKRVPSEQLAERWEAVRQKLRELLP